MSIKAILWDFGDTLADERWMLAPMAGSPRWPELYQGELMNGTELIARWNIGAISSEDVAAIFGKTLNVPALQVVEHMEECSRRISFFPGVMEIVEGRLLPQAIVTINPDIFSRIVVPTFGLVGKFDAILTSWEQKTASKADLCDTAIARLDSNLSRAECLLIDNRPDCIEEWTARGGTGYRFVDERSLVASFADVTGIRG